MALVAAQVKDDDESFCEYTVPIQAIAGNESGDSGIDIKKATARLVSAKLYIDSMWYTLFAKCGYDPKRGVILVSFHSDLKDHYINLRKNFTQDHLDEYLMLRSTYSQNLYLLLNSCDGPEKPFDLPYLHDQFTVPKKVRDRFFDFNRIVLESAKKHINEHSSLMVDYHVKHIYPTQSKSKVTGITFIFSRDKDEFKAKADELAEWKKANSMSKADIISMVEEMKNDLI